MRITDRLYVVGSKQLGLSGPWDSHVYIGRADFLLVVDKGAE